MNISYNWLKEYVNFDLTPDETAAALTSIGWKQVVVEVQTIKGGLEGLVIGEVLTCEEHPNSDHLHITTVNLGDGEPVQIVCGAPNVAAGQKVVVATWVQNFMTVMNALLSRSQNPWCRIYRDDLCRRRNRYWY